MKIYEEKLDNGLKIVYAVKEGFRTATVNFWFNVAIPDKPGLSHFVEHLIMDCQDLIRKQQLNSKEKYWLDSTSATTTDDCITFSVKLHQAEITSAISFFNKFFFKRDFNLINTAETRETVVNEIKSYESDFTYKAYVKLRKNRFKTKTHISVPVIGCKNTVSQINKNDTIRYYHGNFLPHRLLITIVGGFDQKIIQGKIKQVFDKPYSTTENRELSPLIKMSSKIIDIDRKKSGQVFFILSYPGYAWQHNLRERLAVNLLSWILCGLQQSRLFQTLRIKNQLVYDIFAETVFESNYGLINFSGQCDKKNIKLVFNLITEEIKRIKTVLINNNELKWFKDYLNRQNIVSEDNLDDLSYDFTEEFFYTGMISNIEKIITERKKITARSLQKIANELFNESNLNFIVTDY